MAYYEKHFLKLWTTLKIKGWYLKNKIFKCTLSLTPGDKLTLVAFMYTVSEKRSQFTRMDACRVALCRWSTLSGMGAFDYRSGLLRQKKWSAQQLHESYLEKERAIREADHKNARLKAKIEILEAQLTKQSDKEMISSEND